MKIFCIKYLIIIITIVLSSCQSLIYSPIVQMPSDPIKKSEIQVSGSLALYPETSPDDAKKQNTFGGEFSARYGLSENLSIWAKGWGDYNNLKNRLYEDIRYGYSLSACYLLNDSTADYRHAAIGSLVGLMYGKKMKGFGISMLWGVWMPKISIFHPYIAAGPLIGIQNNLFSYWGWGATINIGAAIKIIDGLELNWELSNIFQRDESKNRNYLIFTPGLGLSYRF